MQRPQPAHLSGAMEAFFSAMEIASCAPVALAGSAADAFIPVRTKGLVALCISSFPAQGTAAHTCYERTSETARWTRDL